MPRFVTDTDYGVVGAEVQFTLLQDSDGKTRRMEDAVAAKKIHSPFRYAGGKFYALKHILPIIPAHACYVEPFCGGGRVYFAKAKARDNWLNDMDANLINCYANIRDHAEAMADALTKEVATKERHAQYKHSDPRTSLGRAIRWYYLNRTSFSGIMKTANCHFGHDEKYNRGPAGWGPRIMSCSAKMQHAKITCLDFEKVIDGAPDGAFLFVDPPYYATDQHKFYTHSFAEPDHLRLRDALQRNGKRLNFLLTYDDHQDVRSMYEWAEMDNKEWCYAINRTDDQRSGARLKDGFRGVRDNGTELFIRNYPVQLPRQTRLTPY